MSDGETEGKTDDSTDSPPEPTVAPAAPRSSMSPRFNFFFRFFAKRFFGGFSLEPAVVDRLRDLEQRGTVVYVMRYSSRLDYFLFNALFNRHGLRLSSFANGIDYYLAKPILGLLRTLLFIPRGRSREVVHEEHQAQVRSLTRSGGSFFLFLRSERLRAFLRGKSRRRQDELDLISEVVDAAWDGERPVFVVPLAIFWRKGPRTESRFLNLDYGSLTRPSDVAKVTSFLLNYRALSVKTGEAIDLGAFIAANREQGANAVARKVRRAILIWLYREEKVVEGPTLRPGYRVLREVLEDSGVRRAMQVRAGQKGQSPEKAERAVEKFYREIAASMNSTQLAIWSSVLDWLFGKLFSSVDTVGLEKVAEYAKRHPIVLVPSHRSYFDFLILSWLFYQNYLVPPHIAARENMAFGPFGYLFRHVGAFFLRRSFDDPLYKEVFRAYVAYLVREGFTQEFFIEGGRSRTGKTLTPRLGMLSWDVDAFLESTRRDLFFVPIAITYERLVEEGGMVDELEGSEKQGESMLGLLRARKFLERRFGSVHVSFGEPISLADSLGARREAFAGLLDAQAGGRADAIADDPELAEIAEQKRAFVDGLGHRIVERINWAVVANATSVAAAVFLGSRHNGLLREQLAHRMREMVELLQMQDVRLTSALRADLEDFDDAISFLLRSDLVKTKDDPRGELLFFEESRRRALDIYRNSIAHYLAAPSLLARGILRGRSRKELREDLAAWQDVLYHEFFMPRAEVLAAHVDAYLEHFERSGWAAQEGDRLVATAAGQDILRTLSEQTQGELECYDAAVRTLLESGGDMTRDAFLEGCAATYENSRLLGEARCAESATEQTFANVAEMLVRHGMLETVQLPPEGRGRGKARGRPVRAFAPGERFDALSELRDRLAGAVVAG